MCTPGVPAWSSTAVAIIAMQQQLCSQPQLRAWHGDHRSRHLRGRESMLRALRAT
jgi:hypothetical protein